MKKPYFHCDENGKCELRIPMCISQTRLAVRIYNASGLCESVLAAEMAKPAVDWLSAFENAETKTAENFAKASVEHYEQEFAMLLRFHESGWVRRSHIDALLRQAKRQMQYDTPRNIKSLRVFVHSGMAALKKEAPYVLPEKYRQCGEGVALTDALCSA